MISNGFRCNVCGSTSAKKLLTINEPDRFEKAQGVNESEYKRIWVQCEDCGIAVNRMTKASQEAINNVESSYYEIDLGDESELQKKYDYVMNLPEQKSDNAGRVKRILEYLKGQFKDFDTLDICDVGSGLGVFPSKLMEVSDMYGFENVNVVAIEPDPISFSFLQKSNRFPVINGFFPDAVKGNTFDLVTLNKVLEHISNPVEVVKSIAGHIKPEKGLAYIEVPCISNIWKKPPYDGSLGALHYNLYSINSLSLMIETAGLTTVLAERIIEPSGKITVYAIAKII